VPVVVIQQQGFCVSVLNLSKYMWQTISAKGGNILFSQQGVCKLNIVSIKK